jgi:hypothetical protein
VQLSTVIREGVATIMNADLGTETSAAKAPPALSSAAEAAIPHLEKYKGLRDPVARETAADFVLRVYAPFVGKGLTLAHLHRNDPKLYRALMRQGAPEAFREGVPRRQDVSAVRRAAFGPNRRERQRMARALVRDIVPGIE